MTNQSIDKLDFLARRVLDAKKIGFLTGAGVSKESGVPTFRDADGLWNKFRPEELANATAFRNDPHMVWQWYNWRRKLINEVKPNPGHYAIVELEKISEGFLLITQNVDDLHRVAGSESVVELHGNIQVNKCFSCGKVIEGELDFDNDNIPHCECGGLARPGVVWFGEMLPEDAIISASNWTQECDLFFSVGTSTAVFPAAGLPYEAKKNGAYLIEINPQPTDLTPFADVSIQAPSGEVLPKIVEAMNSIRGARG